MVTKKIKQNQNMAIINLYKIVNTKQNACSRATFPTPFEILQPIPTPQTHLNFSCSVINQELCKERLTCDLTNNALTFLQT